MAENLILFVNFQKETKTNYLSWGKKNRKFDFFLGGADACQGNIFRYINQVLNVSIQFNTIPKSIIIHILSF